MPTPEELRSEIEQKRAELAAAETAIDRSASVAKSMLSVSLQIWSQAFQLIAVERADAIGVLAVDAAAVIGLSAIAAARNWPHHWWWSVPIFVLSGVVCVVVPLVPLPWLASRFPQAFRPTSYSLPNVSEMYEQALGRLPDEAASQTDTVSRVVGLAAKDIASAQRRRGFNTVALGILAVGVVFTLIIFLPDFK